jgi:uncharacterized protein Yka (UPF0111/DUF47 family)
MNAFDMVSEPVFFTEQLCEHSNKVHECVGLIPLLAEALLTQDGEKIGTLHGQICKTREEVDLIKLSLYEQIKNMHFHRVGGAFNQYLVSQDKVADATQEFADLLISRQTAVPVELHPGFRALVARIVSVSNRTICLIDGLSSDAPTNTEVQDPLDVIRAIHDDSSQARRLEREFAQCFCHREVPLDPVTILFLDRCCTTLHEVAENAGHTADQLCLMIR